MKDTLNPSGDTLYYAYPLKSGAMVHGWCKCGPILEFSKEGANMDEATKKAGQRLQKTSLEDMKREILGKTVSVPPEGKRPTTPKKYGRGGYGR